MTEGTTAVLVGVLLGPPGVVVGVFVVVAVRVAVTARGVFVEEEVADAVGPSAGGGMSTRAPWLDPQSPKLFQSTVRWSAVLPAL